MLPRWHIILGAVFCIVLKLFAPAASWFSLGLVFLASFLIDFDHYATSAWKTGRFSLLHSFEYHRKQGSAHQKEHVKGIRRKGDFHVFHTIEFHLLVAVLGLFFSPLFYVFIGMVFHSLLDIGWMMHHGVLYRREFFFSRWLQQRF
ncbi:hypothetical protein HYZ97_03305 [Candidatus Pacearchaeota archaeon]|nr:hypothetical protein [Candidatus Pacearchaeota archaeon]